MSQWQTVRVFISSTFRDMHAERDHLIKVTFPGLRERLEKYRIYLDDIDLRWGVTREQAENDQVLDLCLQQIDKCRPFFIGILGERYGWVPTRYPADAVKKFGWIQHHTGKSVTELEILHGVLQDSKMRGRAFFYFRAPVTACEVPESVRWDVYAETDAELISNLEDLKRRIRSSGYPVMENYPAHWDPDAFDRPSRSKGRLVDLKAFGERVHDQLWQAIQEEFRLSEQTDAVAVADPLAEEQDFHERFMESRLRVYVGRKSVRNDLARYADGDDTFPCLVTGASGSGKSAALARFVRVYTRARRNTRVISHFIGASPRSTNLRDMLRRFCQVLKDRFSFAEEVPEEVAKLSVTFREFIARVPADARVLLVIDALNQLDEVDSAQELFWLPSELPRQFKVIVSCITDSDKTEPILEAFRWRKHHPVEVTALTDAEQRLIIRHVPSLSAKTLDDDQARLLLSNPATANPLFLLVALEELRGFTPYERLNERIAAFPREGDFVTAIFTQVIERLAEEFNQTLVEAVLTLLASARRGLSERELQELVAGRDGADDLFPVLRQLRPYLLSRAGLIDFYHRSLVKAVRERYFDSEEIQYKVHARLAEYFTPTDDSNAQRTIDEWPWQLLQSRQWDRLKTCITDYRVFHRLDNHRRRSELMSYWKALKDKYDVVEEYTHALAPLVAGLDSWSRPRVEQTDLSHDFVIALFNGVARCLGLCGRADGAVAMQRLAYKMAVEFLGDEHPITVGTLHHLALLLGEAGDDVLAEPILRKSLQARETLYGQEHPAVADSLLGLAALLLRKHKVIAAEQLLKRALRILEHPHEEESATRFYILNSLGVLLEKKGDAASAEALFRQSVQAAERCFGRMHWDTAIAIHNVGQSLLNKGDYKQAEKCFDDAMIILEGVVGPQHFLVARVLTSLSNARSQAGDHAAAEGFSRRALEITEQERGLSHPETAVAMKCLALIVEKRGNHEEAARMKTRALAIERQRLDPLNPEIASTLDSIISGQLEQGIPATAEPYIRQRLEIARVKDAASQETIENLNNLAESLRQQGNLRRAEPLFQQALTLQQELNPSCFVMAVIYNNYALLLYAGGKSSDALKYMARAHQVAESALGSQDERVCKFRENLRSMTRASVKQAWVFSLSFIILGLAVGIAFGIWYRSSWIVGGPLIVLGLLGCRVAYARQRQLKL